MIRLGTDAVILTSLEVSLLLDVMKDPKESRKEFFERCSKQGSLLLVTELETINKYFNDFDHY